MRVSKSDSMSNKSDTWIDILIGVLAVSAIVSIFSSDESKIISKNGRKALSDDKRMSDLIKKIEEAEEDSNNKHILI